MAKKKKKRSYGQAPKSSKSKSKKSKKKQGQSNRQSVKKQIRNTNQEKIKAEKSKKSDSVSRLTPQTQTETSEPIWRELAPVDQQKINERVADSLRAKAEAEQRQKLEELAKLKNKAIEVIDEANRRWDLLDNYDFRSLAISRALEESGGKHGFELDGLVNKEDIIAEVTRARVFLADETSTLPGAENYTQTERNNMYKGMFGNQWKKEYGVTYNKDRIDESFARVAFKVYRDIESLRAADIGFAGGYGSENMIIAIYDIVTRYGYTDPDNENDRMDVVMDAQRILDNAKFLKSQEFERMFGEKNAATGLFWDRDEGEEDDYFGRQW